MTKLVRPSVRRSIARWMSSSVRVSTELVASSSTKIFGLAITARAKEMSCFSPVESLSPHFDRTTVLSFRCRPVNGIVSDHEELVDAIAARDRERAAETARRHMLRYTENIDTIRQAFPEYFA